MSASFDQKYRFRLSQRATFALNSTLTLSFILSMTAGCKEETSAPTANHHVQVAAPEATPQQAAAAPQAAAPQQNSEGERLFKSACANCHGLDGTGAMMRGMMPNIGDLTSPELHTRLNDEALLNMIKNGRDKMPPFQTIFNPEQMAEIVRYVRSLKKQ